MNLDIPKAYALYDRDPRVNGMHDFDAFQDSLLAALGETSTEEVQQEPVKLGAMLLYASIYEDALSPGHVWINLTVADHLDDNQVHGACLDIMREIPYANRVPRLERTKGDDRILESDLPAPTPDNQAFDVAGEE